MIQRPAATTETATEDTVIITVTADTAGTEDTATANTENTVTARDTATVTDTETINNSILVSADSAHALHPNAPWKNDPTNKVYLNKGIVKRIEKHGKNEILVVKNDDKNYLIPYNFDIIDGVDLEKREMYVKNIIGLFD